jgi:uracil-DNA glycosylase
MNKSKILIIGQALPAVKQDYPYNTTMLYEILSWVGINMLQAQKIFAFDAVYNDFPGYDSKGNHRKPSQEQMEWYWKESLETKVQLADKVILLGNVSKDFFYSQPKTWDRNLKILELIHPSRLNYNRIINSKKEITEKLKIFLNEKTT